MDGAWRSGGWRWHSLETPPPFIPPPGDGQGCLYNSKSATLKLKISATWWLKCYFLSKKVLLCGSNENKIATMWFKLKKKCYFKVLCYFKV